MTYQEIAESLDNQINQLTKLLKEARAEAVSAYRNGRREQADADIALLMSMAEERDSYADRLHEVRLPPYEDRQVARYLRRAAKHIRAGRDSL